MSAEHDHIGGFAVPSDIEGYTFVPQLYQPGELHNLLGTEMELEPTFEGLEAIEVDETGWVIGGGAQPAIPPGSQAKFRLSLAGASHILADDPIRNFGHPGASHWHMFYGNRATNAHSTHASLRTRNASGSAGGPLNGTGYWAPAILVDNAFGTGKTYAVRSEAHVVYYNDNDVLNTYLLSLLQTGVRYIMGQNMDDPHQTFLDDIILAANSQPGTNPYRYRRLSETGVPNKPVRGFNGWKMLSPDNALITPTNADVTDSENTYSWGFTNLDGSDPWDGQGEPELWGGRLCKLVAVLSAPHYWDGVNPWSPGGYNHFSYGIFDTEVGKYVGPHGWFKVPGLEQQLIFRHNGWADYSRWYLSSDAHFESGWGSPIRPGFSMHGDWFEAWQRRIRLLFQTHCNGAGNNEPHECVSNYFNDGEGLKYTGQAVDFEGDTSTPDGMWLIPSTGTGKGPITIRTRHT